MVAEHHLERGELVAGVLAAGGQDTLEPVPVDSRLADQVQDCRELLDTVAGILLRDPVDEMLQARAGVPPAEIPEDSRQAGGRLVAVAVMAVGAERGVLHAGVGKVEGTADAFRKALVGVEQELPGQDLEPDVLARVLRGKDVPVRPEDAGMLGTRVHLHDGGDGNDGVRRRYERLQVRLLDAFELFLRDEIRAPVDPFVRAFRPRRRVLRDPRRAPAHPAAQVVRLDVLHGVLDQAFRLRVRFPADPGGQPLLLQEVPEGFREPHLAEPLARHKAGILVEDDLLRPAPDREEEREQGAAGLFPVEPGGLEPHPAQMAVGQDEADEMDTLPAVQPLFPVVQLELFPCWWQPDNVVHPLRPLSRGKDPAFPQAAHVVPERLLVPGQPLGTEFLRQQVVQGTHLRLGVRLQRLPQDLDVRLTVEHHALRVRVRPAAPFFSSSLIL